MKAKTKKITIWTSIGILGVTFVSLITWGIVNSTTKSNTWKNDGIVEIWVPWNESDQLYWSFQETFVDTWNEKYSEETGNTIVLVSFTPSTSAANDIMLKMQSGAEIPNILVGVPADVPVLIGQGKDTYVMSISDIEGMNSEISNSVVGIVDPSRNNKEVKGYVPYLTSTDILYINKNLLNQFLDEGVAAGKFTVNSEFDLLLEPTSGDIPDIDVDFDFSSVNVMTTEINVDYFNSWENIFELAKIWEQAFIGYSNVTGHDDVNFWGFDNYTRGLYQETASMINSDINNWYYTTDDYFAFKNNLTLQSNFMQIIDSWKAISGTTWMRSNSGTNPTSPMLNNDLVMFSGAVFNIKYLNSDSAENMQWDEVLMLPSPTKAFNTSSEMMYFTTKALIPFQFTSDMSSSEDKATSSFVAYVTNTINSDFYIETGYLPPLLSGPMFDDYVTTLNEKISSGVFDSEKQKWVSYALNIPTQQIVSNPTIEKFYLPTLEPMNIYESVFNDAIWQFMHGDLLTSQATVDYIINQVDLLLG